MCYGLSFFVTLTFFAGTLTNIKNLIVASSQKVTLSSQTKTSTFSNNQRTYESLPGQYSFSQFTIKDNAEVTLEETGHQINFNTLEQNYGSRLVGKNLDIAASKLILNPGSTLDMTGQGYTAGLGPGQGQVVCTIFALLVRSRSETSVLFPVSLVSMVT